MFVAGLMVGRTPEYLGKKIGAREIKFASLYFLTTPALVLIGTALAMALGGARASMLNSGPHGFSEVLYAFTSARQQQRLGVRRHHASTPPWYNTALGLAMLLGRFLPIVLRARRWPARWPGRQPVPESRGTLPTHRPLFVGMFVGVRSILVGLTYFPALALGPLAEGLH